MRANWWRGPQARRLRYRLSHGLRRRRQCLSFGSKVRLHLWHPLIVCLEDADGSLSKAVAGDRHSKLVVGACAIAPSSKLDRTFLMNSLPVAPVATSSSFRAEWRTSATASGVEIGFERRPGVRGDPWLLGSPPDSKTRVVQPYPQNCMAIDLSATGLPTSRLRVTGAHSWNSSIGFRGC